MPDGINADEPMLIKEESKDEADASDGAPVDEDGQRALPELVDCASVCQDVCKRLLQDSSAIALGLEGVNIGRDGEVCIMQVADTSGKVVLFDIATLGTTAFTCGLKEIFETEKIPKLFYDCRSGADALFHLHKVTPVNVLDMQVLCAKAKGGANPYLQGFSRALDAVMPYQKRQTMKEKKLAGAKLWNPERGGSFGVWKKRPLPDVLREYCAVDVAHLFTLLDNWSNFLPTSVLRDISEERMRKRIHSDVLETGPNLARRDFEFPADSMRRATDDSQMATVACPPKSLPKFAAEVLTARQQEDVEKLLKKLASEGITTLADLGVVSKAAFEMKLAINDNFTLSEMLDIGRLRNALGDGAAPYRQRFNRRGERNRSRSPRGKKDGTKGGKKGSGKGKKGRCSTAF